MGTDRAVDGDAVYAADGQRYYLFEETYGSVFRDVVDELAGAVAADYDPDAVVWINKGGASIGPRVAHFFDELPAGSVTADSYTDLQQQDRVDIYDAALDDVSGNVLLVDDIADSGRTLAAVEDLLRDTAGVDDLRTATIHVSAGCQHPPDHAYERVPEDVWVVYEWEELPAALTDPRD